MLKIKLGNNTLSLILCFFFRFTEIRETIQGKQEERLPFFSFAFPESFKKRFSQEYENFVKNSERLTTPFDIHATLKHILGKNILRTHNCKQCQNNLKS